MFYSDWKIRPRLLLGITVTSLVIVTFVGLILFDLIEEFSADVLPELSSLHRLEVSAQGLVAEYNEYLLESDKESIDEIGKHDASIDTALQQYAATASHEYEEAESVEIIEKIVDTVHQHGALVIESQQTLNQKWAELERLEQGFRLQFDDAGLETRGAEGDVEMQSEMAATGPLESGSDAFYPVRLLLTELHLENLEYARFGEDETRSDIENIRAELDARLARLTASASESAQQQKIKAAIAEFGARFTQLFDEMLPLETQLSERRELLGQAANQLSEVIKQANTIVSAEAKEALNQTLVVMILLTLSMAFVMGLSIWLTASAILKPLFAIGDGARRIGQGDLSTRVEVQAKNEFGDLAAHFNQMAADLQQNEEIQKNLITQLEHKNIELEQFTYTVSHDLKSPLVTVKGFLGLLEKDMVEGNVERAREDMEKIATATDTMGRLLSDLLELSHVGHTLGDFELFSLSQLTEEVISQLRGIIEDSGANIEFAADMPSVFADKQRIGETMQNLLENAIKFSGEGNQPRISVSARERGKSVECRVRDNGIGIDPCYQDKIFGLFDRLDVGVEGTGVGLALVKRIVEAHQGEVWIESDGDGQGTQLCFTLPAPEAN